MSLSRNQLNAYLRQIDITGKNVLDIGVGSQEARRLTVGEPRMYKTLDVDAQWNPNIIFDMNTEVPDIIRPFMDAYDCVFCIEVLEHCWNPIQVCKNIFAFLKSPGEAFISAPLINPHHDKTDYLRYTNEWYRDVLPKIGFTDVQIYERCATTGKRLLEEFFKVESMRVSKIRPEYGRYTYPIGYFVHAIKK